MIESKQIRYRYFFLSFTASFLVLSLIFSFLIRTVRPNTPRSLDAEPDTANSAPYTPSREDALSVLFVGSDTTGGADTFILAKFDPARGRVPLVVFPTETAVLNNGKLETLGNVFKYGGADYTRKALSSALGVPIDRYARINTDSFIIAANAVGTVEFELSHKVVVGSDGAVPMTLGTGVQLVDGLSAARIIGYGDYEGGELTRCDITVELAAAIVNQRMDIALSTVVDKVFEKIVNLIDTDISYIDYESRKQAAEYLAKLGQEPGVPMRAAGEYNQDESLYTLSDTFIALLTQTFV